MTFNQSSIFRAARHEVKCASGSWFDHLGWQQILLSLLSRWWFQRIGKKIKKSLLNIDSHINSGQPPKFKTWDIMGHKLSHSVTHCNTFSPKSLCDSLASACSRTEGLNHRDGRFILCKLCRKSGFPSEAVPSPSCSAVPHSRNRIWHENSTKDGWDHMLQISAKAPHLNWARIAMKCLENTSKFSSCRVTFRLGSSEAQLRSALLTQELGASRPPCPSLFGLFDALVDASCYFCCFISIFIPFLSFLLKNKLKASQSPGSWWTSNPSNHGNEAGRLGEDKQDLSPSWRYGMGAPRIFEPSGFKYSYRSSSRAWGRAPPIWIW